MVVMIAIVIGRLLHGRWSSNLPIKSGGVKMVWVIAIMIAPLLKISRLNLVIN